MAHRGRRYKLLLETAPWWQIAGAVLSFFILFSVALIIGSLGPPVYSTKLKSKVDTSSILTSGNPLEGTIGNMSPLNRDFYFYAEFYRSREAREENLGFEQHNVGISVDLEARKSSSDKFTRISTGIKHNRTLSCAYNKKKCEPMVLFHQQYVAYEEYQMKVNFHNLDEIVKKNLVATETDIGFVYLNASAVRFEILWRYFFVAVSAIVTIAFLLFVRRKQYFASWHTEQKWTLALLICLIFCNNPFYVGDLHWIFPLLHVIFTVTFLSVFLLALLVFTHSILVPLPRRTFLLFYLPKLVLVGTFWLVNCIAFFWSSFHLRDDPAYDETEMPGFKSLQILSISLLVLYALVMLYFVLQILGKLRNMNIRHSARFKTLWGFTLIVALGVFATYAGSLFMGYVKDSSLFMSNIAIYNLYIFSLAFLFLPSKHLDLLSQQDFEDSMGGIMDDDELFVEGDDSSFEL